MKFSLYSNKLDIVYNQLNSDKINSDKFISIKNNMNKIRSIYDKENNFIDLQNDKNSKGLLIEDVNEDVKKSNKRNLTLVDKGNMKNIKDCLNLFEKPKEIFVRNKKMNLDELTKKIAERYNICIKDDNGKNKNFKKNFDKGNNQVSGNGNKLFILLMFNYKFRIDWIKIKLLFTFLNFFALFFSFFLW